MKSIGIFVIERKVCKTCNGNKAVQNPLWAEFWMWRTWGGHTVPGSLTEPGHYARQHELDMQWWRDRGYSELPKEEMTCPDCDGDGTVETEITLEAALKAIAQAEKGATP